VQVAISNFDEAVTRMVDDDRAAYSHPGDRISDEEFRATYRCPVCGYDGLKEPPYGRNGGGSYEICPSCGFQFGYDLAPRGLRRLHARWRVRWMRRGMRWWSGSRTRPYGWRARGQLARAGIPIPPSMRLVGRYGPARWRI